MLNCQAQSITGIYPSILLYLLLFEIGLIPASTLLDYCKRLYAYRLLSLHDQHLAKEILSACLSVGNTSS